MPNFKCANLENAIKSILKQNYENLELIVIDGNSGKDTLKILKSYNEDIDIWISEKDNGMWDAWNKGFQLASGEYVGIVDSSNILFPNAIKTLSKYTYQYSKKDFICGTLKRVGLLDTRYKIQADYDLLYKIIIKNKMSGVNTKGNEIFGDLGDSGFSSKHSFLSKLINEITIRFRNGQNIFYLIYIILGRCFMKSLKPILKNKL